MSWREKHTESLADQVQREVAETAFSDLTDFAADLTDDYRPNRASHALAHEKLAGVVSDARSLLRALCESQLSESSLVTECSRCLAESPLHADRFIDSYLVPFEETV